ncbi:MAG TPA: UDP-3-O-[3-hydroxymyristoyl] N-acetylglucosamine deacetylase [Campylobacterales bacterium]|nr:UDP-3-O-[3-hydroxymyristoyl] N-acetylglucosamine deacetylase [Campylobacterales bacterium]
MREKTIKEEVQFSGISLHKGKISNLKLKPLPENSGIVFQYRNHKIPLSPNVVVNTNMATSIGNGEVEIFTIEHLMSAVWSLGISNLLVEMDSVEPPILDGSSIQFLEKIEDVGVVEQESRRPIFIIEKEITIREGDRYVSISPNREGKFSIYSKIDFANRAIGVQEFSIDIDLDSYRKEIAPARTFGFLQDFERLKSQGLALGANLDNVIAVGESEIVNPEGLRFQNEFVRHKILDTIGDLSIIGVDFVANYRAFASSHKLNHKLIQKLLSDKSNYRVEYS